MQRMDHQLLMHTRDDPKVVALSRDIFESHTMHHSDLYNDANIVFAVLFRLIITAHNIWSTPYHWPVCMFKNYDRI